MEMDIKIIIKLDVHPNVPRIHALMVMVTLGRGSNVTAKDDLAMTVIDAGRGKGVDLKGGGVAERPAFRSAYR